MSTDEKSPLLSHSEFRQLQWLLGSLLAMLSAGAVLFLEIEAWGLLAGILAVSTVMLFRADLPARLPRWVHRLAFPVIVGLFGYDLWSAEGLLPSMVRLSLWLLLYRAMCHRRRREDLQLVLLGLFLIVVAGVLTVSIAFTLLLVLFTLCALALLLVVTTGDSLASGGEQENQWYQSYSVPRVLRRVRRTLDWRQALGALGLFALLVGASAVIFVSIPRFQLENSLFLDRLFPRKASTGFSDTIRFGEVTEISQDNSLVFTVDTGQGESLPRAPYFRMLVLDEYLPGGGFRASALLKREAFLPERSTTTLEGVPRLGSAADTPWVVYLEPGMARNLPLPGAWSRVRLRDSLVLREAHVLRLIQLRDEPMAMLPFRIEGAEDSPEISDPLFLARLRQFPGEARQRVPRRFFLEVPTDKASRELLAGMSAPLAAGAGADSPLQFAEAARRWLVGRHRYSLNSSLPSGAGDSVVRWMQSEQPGHCELFAASLVLLSRSAGYPARVVVGFRGGTWNAFSNSLSIRNRDAHAWCEIWDGRGSWIRFDPTPGAQAAVVDAASATGGVPSDSSWLARFEGLRVLWYRRIVNFDQQTQVDTLLRVRRWLQELRESAGRLSDSAREGLSGLFSERHRFAGVFMLGGTAVLAVLLSWLVITWRRKWRWRLPRRHSTASLDPVRREAGKWLRRVGREVPDSGVRAHLERLRYGHPDTWRRPDLVFAEARRELRAAAGTRGPSI